MIKKWIQSVVAFLLLMSLVGQLIPEDKYRKYIRLTTGLILILVMIVPITQLLNLDEQVLMSLIQSEMHIASAEAKSLESFFDTSNTFVKQYKSMIAEEIHAYFEAVSVKIRRCEIEINEDSKSSAYGNIDHIRIEISPADQIQRKNTAESDIQIDKVDIGNQNKTSEDFHIPQEKMEEWKQELLLWFDLKENQLELEIVS